MFKIIKATLVFFALASIAYCGTTWTVDDDAPADFSSIQEVGTYSEASTINFLGRAIIVRSTDPNDDNVVENTWIDTSIRFDNGENNASILMGFKITQGIDCYYSNPTISHCDIRSEIRGDNASPLISNCKFVLGSSPRIFRCDGLIINCFFDTESFGSYIEDSDGEVKNCYFDGFHISSGTNNGNALYNCNATVDNCYFTRFQDALLNFEGVVNNSTFNTNTVAIIHQDSGYKGDVINCTISNSNIGIFGNYKVRNSIIVNSNNVGLYQTNGDSNYNNLWGNINANYSDGAIPGANDIHRNPLFVDEISFRLKSTQGHYFHRYQI